MICSFFLPSRKCKHNWLIFFLHIRTVQRLDIIKVLFIHQLLHQWVVLKNNITIYIKTAPTCFAVTVTPSSGGALICACYTNLLLGLDNFHIRTVQRLDIIKVLFIQQLMHQWVVLKNNITIYIKTVKTLNKSYKNKYRNMGLKNV